MVSAFVMTELHLRKIKETPASIGMGSYNMDSHNVQRYVAKDESGKAFVLNEGDVQVNPGGPYQISYGSIVPKSDECQNLLVPVCVSSSHIAFGSIRMEPVFMILGQSAATAAVFSIEDEVAVQDVSYEKLSSRLREDGQILKLEQSDRIARGHGIDPKTLTGIVIDGNQVKFEGDWVESSSLRPFVGSSYFHDENGGKGVRSASFPFNAPNEGLHEIMVSFVPFANRAGKVNYEIKHEKGLVKVTLDQRKKGDRELIWHSLGSFLFHKGKSYSVTVSNEGTEGYVIADAVQVIPLDR